ncbi:hypothetical protein LCGC14_1106040 [marine sediment metagenome]|uniref:Restriction alleviation protein, Lar family n=1 Tax=marine sediment metagenome TaxID=412755 RepID=A0A0F9PRA3_9ZZZZ
MNRVVSANADLLEILETATGTEYARAMSALDQRMSDSLQKQLKDCPFCGGRPELRAEGGMFYQIVCTSCHARCGNTQVRRGKDYEDMVRRTAAKCVMHWNRRTP